MGLSEAFPDPSIRYRLYPDENTGVVGGTSSYIDLIFDIGYTENILKIQNAQNLKLESFAISLAAVMKYRFFHNIKSKLFHWHFSLLDNTTVQIVKLNCK